LGVFFDCGLRWSTQVQYVQRRCLQRLNFMNSIAGTWWGAHPKCMLLLYQGLIGSVVEYASICYGNMAKTHLIKLERIQYRGIRIALGLMRSTPNISLGILSGIPPLEERFSYLNANFLIKIFGKFNHPLQKVILYLKSMNPERCMKGTDLVNLDNITATMEYFRFDLDALTARPKIDYFIFNKLKEVEKEFYSIIAPSEVSAITDRYQQTHVFYTYGSLIEDQTGFGIHNYNECKIEQKLQSPSSVFSAEILAIKSALEHISNKPQGKYIISTDSMSSLMALESRKFSCRSHPFVLLTKQIYFELQISGHDVALSWVPAHTGIPGNEIADEMAKNATINGTTSTQPPIPNDFRKLTKHHMMQKWTNKWKNCDTGRLTHSIFQEFAVKPWFHECQEDRRVVTTISRIITGHCSVKSHLQRFNIVDDPLCVCQQNYETVDHLLWECRRYDRQSVVLELSPLNVHFGTPIRDICAQKKWEAMKVCHSFFKNCDIKI
jgi:ribonuclease HI